MVKHEPDYDYIRPSKFVQCSNWIPPLVVFIGAFALYIKTMAPSIFWGYSAAFATTNYTLGLPHPPSFPLYTILGRLFNLLPGIPPAFSSNLMSALFAALSVLLFYLIIMHLVSVPVLQPKKLKKPLTGRKQALERPGLKRESHTADLRSAMNPTYSLLPSLAATALFAVSLPVWLSAVRTEVYSLHLFLSLGALLFCILGVDKNNRKLFLLGIWLYALSFGNHPLLALAFAPAFLYLAFLNFRHSGQKFRTLAVIVLFFVVAFSAYLYLPFRSVYEPTMNEGGFFDFGSFWTGLMNSSGWVESSGVATLSDYLLKFKKLGFFLSKQIGWPLIGLVIFGLWGISRISKRFFPFFLLALVFNLAIILWAADLNSRDFNLIDFSAPVIGLILLISIAGSLHLLRIKIPINRASVFIAVLVGAFVYVAVENNSAKADMSGIDGADIISQEILNGLPTGSLVLVAEDNLLYPMWHRTYVDSSARNIAVLSPGVIANPLYRQQIMLNYPDLIYPEGFISGLSNEPKSLMAEICRLNADMRDIYVQLDVPGIGYREVEPAGVLFKYVGQHQSSRLDKDIRKKHLQLMERILSGNPHEARTVEFCGKWLFSLGVYFGQIGNQKVAWELFNKALDIDKESIQMRVRLATSLAQVGQYRKALKYISDALEIDSQDPPSLKLGQHIIDAMRRQKPIASR